MFYGELVGEEKKRRRVGTEKRSRNDEKLKWIKSIGLELEGKRRDKRR